MFFFPQCRWVELDWCEGTEDVWRSSVSCWARGWREPCLLLGNSSARRREPKHKVDAALDEIEDKW